MDKLEKYILENRELFEDNEPPKGHLDRFEDRLDSLHGKKQIHRNPVFFLKIAAALLILVSVSFFVYEYAWSKVGSLGGDFASGRELPEEVMEAINYYDNSADTHLKKIQKLACCGKDSRNISSMATDEMNALDANTKELRKAFDANPGDDRIQSALIRNQQMKETIMNNMIRQMNNAKK